MYLYLGSVSILGKGGRWRISFQMKGHARPPTTSPNVNSEQHVYVSTDECGFLWRLNKIVAYTYMTIFWIAYEISNLNISSVLKILLINKLNMMETISMNNCFVTSLLYYHLGKSYASFKFICDFAKFYLLIYFSSWILL